MHTHARKIVQGFVCGQLSLIHAARRELWCAAVSAVMGGHLLSLSRLARALMGQSTQKAALKRVDRLMGNQRIGQEAQVIGAALLRVLCRGGQPLVIAVDWSEVAPGGVFVELRASATRTGMGRGLTIYQQVYPESKLGNARAQRALLETLHGWMPAGVQVIIVTDAGFRRPWFTQVERLGWSWIGRIRAGVCVSREGVHWEPASAWFAKASGKACRWSDCWLTRQFRFACDMVLYRRRAVGGQALWARRSRLDAEGAARGESQRPRAVAARALAATSHLACTRNCGPVWAAHADRGELPRQQVHAIGYGTRGQSIALGATVACTAPDRHLGGVSALAHRPVGRGRRVAPAIQSHHPRCPRTVDHHLGQTIVCPAFTTTDRCRHADTQ
jgi:hypothetical protein